MSRSETVRSVDAVHDADWSEAQRTAILAECDAILAHPAFRTSKRCVALLRHLTGRVLAGDHEAIKERILGIEVFRRQPEYDTNSDPIVRMTANEIRKRLALCYQDSARHTLVKIRMVPGTYVLQFDFGESEHSLASDGAEIFEEVPGIIEGELEQSEIVPNVRFSLHHPRIWILVAAAGLLAIAVVAVMFLRAQFFPSAQTLIWEPLLGSRQPVTICVGSFNAFEANSWALGWAQEVNQVVADHALPKHSVSSLQLPAVSIVDTKVAGKVSSWLATHHKPATIQSSNNLRLEDLRRGPVVLIGEFNNPWTLILLSELRYHVRVDPTTLEEWIEDARNPANHAWKSSGKLGHTDSSIDYAIISRVLDHDTGQWILEAGGLGVYGTEAAAELITDPEYNRLLPAKFGSTRKENFQIVLKMTVIGGNTGPPEIVAEYTW